MYKFEDIDFISFSGLHPSGLGVYTVDSGISKHHIEKVIFNPPATIVFFTDGTKEVVKCNSNDVFIPEVGVAMAIMNKIFDSRSQYKKFVKQYVTDSITKQTNKLDKQLKKMGYLAKHQASNKLINER